MRRNEHPSWCGLGHVCSADRPGGEHRSHPASADTQVGRVVVTRVQTSRGVNRLEIRTVVDLPTDPRQARSAAFRAMRDITLAVGHNRSKEATR